MGFLDKLVGFLQVIESLIYALGFAKDITSETKVKNALLNEQMALESMRDKINKQNKIDNSQLATLSNSLNHLSTIRYSIDPRAIARVDKAISAVQGRMSDIQTRMSTNANLYDTALNSQAPKENAAFSNVDGSGKIYDLSAKVESGSYKENRPIISKFTIKGDNYETKI